MKTCTYCGEGIQDKAKKCRYCGEWFDKSDNNDTEVEKEVKKKHKKEVLENNGDNHKSKNDEINGLDGWLIFVGLGLIATPFVILATISSVYIPMINDGSFAQLITKTSSSYIEWFLPLSIFEFVGNFIFIIFSSILLYLFFSKYKLFPLLFKIYVTSFFIFHLLDNILPDLIPEIAEIEDNSEYLIELARSFIYMLVWGSYMHVSVRVKNTFIEKDYKNKKILPIILLIIILFSVFGTLSKIDTSKFSFDEYDFGTDTCVEAFGINSYYTEEQEDGQYLCDCEDGYEFGGENNDTCIIIK